MVYSMFIFNCYSAKYTECPFFSVENFKESVPLIFLVTKLGYTRPFQAKNVYHLYNFGKTLENTF